MADPGDENFEGKKRKRKFLACKPPLKTDPSSSYECCEGKIFKLLQVREEMLKLDHHKRKVAVLEDGKGLHLIHLLLITATSVDENSVNSALDNLTRLYRTPFYEMIMKEPTIEEEILPFTCLYKVSPYYQFAHFTANQAIIEAFEKEDLKTEHCMLSTSMSLMAFNGLLSSIPFRKGHRWQPCIVPFNQLRNKLSATARNRDVRHDESVHSLRPSIVVLVEQEGRRSPRSLLSRFMGSLHYFAAMFDSLDDCLPVESAERLSMERKHLGKEIKSMINCDEDEENS
ncbi:hypothetical protein F3Y22_tig00112305pilonHSYRG00119 [Hibiscus syriacus]|uniref:Uncharacterized protein n=1 Tax=Hibiscus syriacus TaxID=106335 RepID=A0A6A2XNF9_HIBSY|nr:hypothetical protein F3Y22_tig00112305pilonHSYRG00119 [Hibiscus syriacus]